MISGIVIGDIVAPQGIKLLSSAAVIGDVTTRRLVVEDRVVLHGKCIGVDDPDSEAKARKR